MDAELAAFLNDLSDQSREETICICTDLYQQNQNLSRTLSELQNATNEISLQFQQMKAERDAALYENAELKKQNLHLTQVAAKFQQELFGRSSEKVNHLIEFSKVPEDPLSEESDPEAPQQRGTVIPFKRTKAPGEKSARKTRKDRLAGLPVQSVFELDVESLNEQYGEGNWRIAFWHSHENVQYVKATSYVRRTHTPVISVGLEHVLVTIPWDGALIPKSFASSSLVAQIMYERGCLYLPYYRQEHDPDHFGFPLSRQDACNWANRCALEYMLPVYEHLRRMLRDQPYQQCDETTWRVIRAGEDAGAIQFMWVHCTSELSDDHPIVNYCYEKSRSADHLRRFYEGLDHLIHLSCDAYSAYPAVAAELNDLILLCGCMMHARRRAADAARLLPALSDTDDPAAGSPEWELIRLFAELYRADEPLKRLSAEKRLAKRQKDSKEKADALFGFIHEFDIDDPAASEKMKDAVAYARNHEESLRRFLTDASIPIDNGNCERKVKPAALIRKNSLFSCSEDGARATAITLSLIETARANGADAYYYLKYLLDEMPRRLLPTAENLPDYLNEMLPWSDRYRSYEREQRKQVIRCQIPPDEERPKTPRKKKRQQTA